MKNEKKILYLIPDFDPGKQTLRIRYPIYRIYYEQSNFIESDKSMKTINIGSETTDEMINKHITKYDKVWKSLA